MADLTNEICRNHGLKIAFIFVFDPNDNGGNSIGIAQPEKETGADETRREAAAARTLALNVSFRAHSIQMW